MDPLLGSLMAFSHLCGIENGATLLKVIVNSSLGTDYAVALGTP